MTNGTSEPDPLSEVKTCLSQALQSYRKVNLDDGIALCRRAIELAVASADPTRDALIDIARRRIVECLDRANRFAEAIQEIEVWTAATPAPRDAPKRWRFGHGSPTVRAILLGRCAI
ncbi:MAG TPA: hypothetical protein PLD47_03260 [Aggregatilineales bacterium]|nr:hypothetical protein [Aggregatilineales bacterium]